MPKKSSDVSQGDQILAAQYVNVRDDALNLFAQVGAERVIATGVITIASTYSTFYDIDTQGDASTDDLVTINGGEDGEIIVIRAENAARTVVVKHGTGNIQLKGGYDLPLLDQTQLLMLRYDGANWVEISAGADRIVVFGYNFGSGIGSSVILADDYGDIPFLPAMYLLGLYAMADQSGSISLDVRTETFGTIPDSADSIGTSPCFVMSSVQTKSDVVLSGITREQAAGCWRFVVTVAGVSIEQVAIVGLGVRT